MMQDLSKIIAVKTPTPNEARRVDEERLVEIVSALSHDLRTPLACIKGYLSLLNEKRLVPGTPEWEEYYSLILQECDRLEKMVSAVLEDAVDDRQVKLNCEPVLLPSLLNSILIEESFLSRGHRFAIDVDPGARVLWADPVRLEQVIRNLVDNAVKYSPDKSLVMIRVRKTGDEALFSIADQGEGIAPEHLNRLFERFYRVRDRRSGGVWGTGLGLPIARRIVEAHGGEIWAESSLSRGSTFNFTLPVVDLREDGGETQP